MSREGEIENAKVEEKVKSQKNMLECPDDRVFERSMALHRNQNLMGTVTEPERFG